VARDNRLLVDLLYHNINNEKSTEKFLGSRIFIFQQQGAGEKEKTPCKSGGIYGTQLIKLNHGEILLQVHAYLPKRYSPGIVQVGKAVFPLLTPGYISADGFDRYRPSAIVPDRDQGNLQQ